MDAHAINCPCPCHGGGPWARCAYEGGCGHLHTPAPARLPEQPAGPVSRRGSSYRGTPPPPRPATATGVHRCRRGRRCSWRDEHRRAAQLELPGLCERDHQLVIGALRELPTDYDELGSIEMLEPGSSGPGGSAVRTSHSPPLPLRVDPLALADEIRDELEAWEEVVRDRAGMTPTQGRVAVVRWPAAPPRRVVHRAAHLLAEHLPLLLAIGPTPMSRWSRGTTRAGEHRWLVEADGYAGALRLLELHVRAEALIGHTRLVTHLRGKPCPGCGAETLQVIAGEGRARCTTCRDDWAEDEYDFLARVLTGEQAAPLRHTRRVWTSETSEVSA